MIAETNCSRLHIRAARAAILVPAVIALGGALPVGCGRSDDRPAPPSRAARPAPHSPAGAADANVGDYFVAVVRARSQAETFAAQMHMRALWQALTAYAVTHGGQFPADLKDLGDRMLLRAPGQDGPAYRYVPGQRDTSPRANVLAYEETAGHGGKTVVLRVGGQVDLLTPEQLLRALGGGAGRNP